MRRLGPHHHYQEAQEKNKNSMHLRVLKDRTSEGVSTKGFRDEEVRVKEIRDHKEGNGGVTEIGADIQLRERE